MVEFSCAKARWQVQRRTAVCTCRLPESVQDATAAHAYRRAPCHPTRAAHPQICVQRLQASGQPPAGAAARLELSLLLRHPDVHRQLQIAAGGGGGGRVGSWPRQSAPAPARGARVTPAAPSAATPAAPSAARPMSPPQLKHPAALGLARQGTAAQLPPGPLTTSGAMRSAATSAGLSARRRSRLNHTMTRRRPPSGRETSGRAAWGRSLPSTSILVGPIALVPRWRAASAPAKRAPRGQARGGARVAGLRRAASVARLQGLGKAVHCL